MAKLAKKAETEKAKKTDATKKPLTDAAVRSFKARPKRYEVPDHGAQFLYLVVQPSGAKSWALRYSIGGKPKKFTLGPVFVLDAKEAEPDRKPEIDQALTLAGARALDAQYAIGIRRGIAPSKDKPTREGPGRFYPEAVFDYYNEVLRHLSGTASCASGSTFLWACSAMVSTARAALWSGRAALSSAGKMLPFRHSVARTWLRCSTIPCASRFPANL
jgi:hypothetical protein